MVSEIKAHWAVSELGPCDIERFPIESSYGGNLQALLGFCGVIGFKGAF